MKSQSPTKGKTNVNPQNQSQQVQNDAQSTEVNIKNALKVLIKMKLQFRDLLQKNKSEAQAQSQLEQFVKFNSNFQKLLSKIPQMIIDCQFVTSENRSAIDQTLKNQRQFFKDAVTTLNVWITAVQSKIQSKVKYESDIQNKYLNLIQNVNDKYELEIIASLERRQQRAKSSFSSSQQQIRSHRASQISDNQLSKHDSTAGQISPDSQTNTNTDSPKILKQQFDPAKNNTTQQFQPYQQFNPQQVISSPNHNVPTNYSVNNQDNTQQSFLENQFANGADNNFNFNNADQSNRSSSFPNGSLQQNEFPDQQYRSYSWNINRNPLYRQTNQNYNVTNTQQQIQASPQNNYQNNFQNPVNNRFASPNNYASNEDDFYRNMPHEELIDVIKSLKLENQKKDKEIRDMNITNQKIMNDNRNLIQSNTQMQYYLDELRANISSVYSNQRQQVFNIHNNYKQML